MADRRRLLVLALLAATYVLTGAAGLAFASTRPPISPIWAPTGLGLAALIVYGRRVWPMVLVSSYLVYGFDTRDWPTALVVAIGDTAQTVLTMMLVNRLAGGRDVFRHPISTIRFFALIAPLTALIGASLGVGLLAALGRTPADATVWSAWALGELSGALVFTPFAVLWISGPWRRSRWQLAETLIAFILLVVIALAVFAGLTPLRNHHAPLQILCVPFLMWAGLRLGRRETATVVVLLTLIAAYGTLTGEGPFVHDGVPESVLLLQLYVGVWSVVSLTLAATVSEHAQAERLATSLSITDPLTGLANLRQLTHEIDVEIARSQRTGRPFSLVFVDVNGLKRINDTLGHLAGNRVLGRVAGVLRRPCRAMDLPARFGGDEFVIVLPETDGARAQIAARRIAREIGTDTSPPPLSVSTGVSEFPRDGTTPAALLETADAALYRAKIGGRAGESGR